MYANGNTIRNLLRSLDGTVEPTLLRDAFALYQQDAVISVQTIKNVQAYARVKTDKTYTVLLDLGFFGSSTCTCLAAKRCEHQLAALFQLLELNGLNPEQEMKRMKATGDTKAARQGEEPVARAGTGADVGAKANSSARAAAVAKPATGVGAVARAASEQAASAKPANPQLPAAKADARKSTPKQPAASAAAETDSPEQWLRFFEQYYAGFKIYDEYQFKSAYREAAPQILAFTRTWNPTIQHIYHLYLILFFMIQSENLHRRWTSQQRYFHFTPDHVALYQELREEFVQLIREMDREQAMAIHPDRLQPLISLLTEHAFPQKEVLVNWSFIYRFMWWNLLRVETWEEKEQARLRRLLKQSKLSPLKRDYALGALANFHVLRAADDQARRLLEQQSTKQPRLFFMHYLRFFVDNEEGERLHSWLDWSLPYMQQGGALEMEYYLQYWETCIQPLSSDRPLKEAFRKLLPEGYPPYSAYLHKTGQYRAWVDLQLTMQLTPEQLNASELRPIEAKHPELLLPLYHRLADEQIAMKNREAYREAVSCLRRLKTLYSKCKKYERFIRFIQELSERYARLRAFQEELRKGKLLS